MPLEENFSSLVLAQDDLLDPLPLEDIFSSLAFFGDDLDFVDPRFDLEAELGIEDAVPVEASLFLLCFRLSVFPELCFVFFPCD